MQNNGNMEGMKSPAQLLLEKLNLKAGSHIKLTKRKEETTSMVNLGESLEGVLDFDVQIGQPIFINNKTTNTSNIRDVGEKDGNVFFRTNTSVYELIRDKIENKKNLTIDDWKHEVQIFAQKGYKDFDLFSGKVPIEDDPNRLLVINNGLSAGDQVIYFSDDKERDGIIGIDSKGSFHIIDSRGNKNGLFAILNSPGNYIRKV